MRAGSRDQDRVIVGVDASLAGLAALREAVEQARCRQAELRVVHVRRAAVPRFTEATASGEVSEQILAEITKADHAALGLIETCLQRALGNVPSDVSIDPVVAVGNVADELCRRVGRDGDLLVVGTRGGRRWRHPHRRSVSRYCLTHAGCAVLVVRRGRFADVACSRYVADRPHVPHDLWRDFDATDDRRQQRTS
jgi:nucleotide-binding universal stress UspA family protein